MAEYRPARSEAYDLILN